MFHAIVKHRGSDASYTAPMFGKYTIAELGALLSDPSRVEILTHVLDGSRHSAGALAIAAGLSPQAASAHLTKLTRGGLLRMTRDGRTRLFELSRPEIGHMLEALGAATLAKPQGGHGRGSYDAVRLARTCYDHLAGQAAILLTRAWIERGVFRGPGVALELTSVGERWFADRGIDTLTLRCQRRAFVRGCLDWTERQPHVGGAVGAAWRQHCLSSGWVARMKGTRAVRVSEDGRKAFQQLLGFDIPNTATQRP
jgi:DNA-binding transcriptional ArsR family regulator